MSPAAATMRSAVVVGPGRVRVRRVPVPEPGPEEVLVRVEGCGICASSLPLWEGRPWFDYPLEPGRPGHEAWGIVRAVGDGSAELRPGDRVAVLSQHGFAEFDAAPAAGCVLLPPELDGEPVPGEPLGCAVNVFRRARIRPGQRVAVVGMGFLGSLVAQLCGRAGAEVVGVRRGDAIAGEFETVVEAAGTQAALDTASRLVSEAGLLVIAGFHQDGPRTVDLQSWNWRGLEVINAHERDLGVRAEGLREAVRLVAAGALDPSGLYTHSFPLPLLEAGFEAARTRSSDFGKALVRM
jgi:threonine dehydrogenase-like Zn-dependent dehydrogenase